MVTRRIGRPQKLLVTYIAAGIISVAVIAIGQNVDWQLITPVGSQTIRRACAQLGGLALVVTCVSAILQLISVKTQKDILNRSTKVATIVVCSFLAMFIVGEGILRWIFRDGMSFGAHVGPIVERFERDFKFNRYDGPSRGPEVWGEKSTTQVRILFQGDSTTWGQGVKDEGDLYTSRLLARLKSENPEIEAAVLAKPGRELDGHLQQLRKWGPKIEPDVIIYQWFINDMEFDKEDRPRRIWQNIFFHPLLIRTSYLWFFLDYRLNIYIPGQGRAYNDYIHEQFAPETKAWRDFAEMFRVWAADAKQLTPRVVVMLFPGTLSSSDVFADIRGRIVDLSRESGIESVDLSPWIDEKFGTDRTKMYATQFDAHPNALVHEMMAAILFERVRVLWPALLSYSSHSCFSADAGRTSGSRVRRRSEIAADSACPKGNQLTVPLG